MHQVVELLVKHIAGGWRNEAGMEMPAYIPAHTTFALHCAHPSAHQKEKAKKDTKCGFQ